MTQVPKRDPKQFHAGKMAASLVFVLLLIVGGIVSLIDTYDTQSFASRQFQFALRDQSNLGEYAMNANQWILWRLQLREEPPPAYGWHRVEWEVSCSWSKVESKPDDK